MSTRTKKPKTVDERLAALEKRIDDIELDLEVLWEAEDARSQAAGDAEEIRASEEFALG